jgi:hypothetical protein
MDTPNQIPDIEQAAQGAPQQLAQALQNQQQPQQPPAQPQPDQIRQGLDTAAQYYQQQIQANTLKPPSGGPIRSLLQNFFSGMGQSMMSEAGLPTPYEKQQKAVTGLQGVANAQGMLDLHQQMASQYAPVPLVGLDGKPVTGPDGKVVSIPANHAATWYAGQAAAASRVQAAQVGGAARIGAAQINQGMLMPVTEEMRQALGLPEGTTQIPLKQLNEAVNSASRPLATIQGANDQFQLNRITGQKTALGVGNPRVAMIQEAAKYKPFDTVIPGTNEPTTVSVMDALRNHLPHVPEGQLQKLGGQYALFNDAYGIMDKIDGLVGKNPGQVDLSDPTVRGRVTAGYAALKEPASHGLAGEVLSNFLARQPVSASMKPEERELILSLAQGKAAATGLRGILGQAGSNEMQQRLDSAMVPGAQGMASEQALKQQTKAMRGLLDRVSVGQPAVGLNAPGSSTALINKRESQPSTGIKYTPGLVRGGYRFKGGDPTKQENWEKQ